MGANITKVCCSETHDPEYHVKNNPNLGIDNECKHNRKVYLQLWKY